LSVNAQVKVLVLSLFTTNIEQKVRKKHSLTGKIKRLITGEKAVYLHERYPKRYFVTSVKFKIIYIQGSFYPSQVEQTALINMILDYITFIVRNASHWTKSTKPTSTI